jgi:hypothetical protein
MNIVAINGSHKKAGGNVLPLPKLLFDVQKRNPKAQQKILEKSASGLHENH